MALWLQSITVTPNNYIHPDNLYSAHPQRSHLKNRFPQENNVLHSVLCQSLQFHEDNHSLLLLQQLTAIFCPVRVHLLKRLSSPAAESVRYSICQSQETKMERNKIKPGCVS